MACELSKIPKKQREFFDMTKCPDCGRIQSNKKAGDYCDNPDCESEVEICCHKGSPKDGMLMWSNPNWS